MRQSSVIATAFLSVIAGAASAQTLSLSLDQGQQTVVVSPRDCNIQHTISWSADTYSNWCTGLQIWVTTSTCGDAPVTGDFVFNTTFQATSRDLQLFVRDLPIFGQADAGSTCGSAINQVHRVCAAAKYPSTLGCTVSSVFVHASTTPTIEYRGVPPAVPSDLQVAPQDGALSVRANASSDTLSVHMQLRIAGTGDFVEAGQFLVSAGGGKIDGLVNGTTYDVRVYGEDAAQNRSDFSVSVQGTPVASEGFYGTYRRNGGSEMGGCGDVGGGGIDWRLVLGVGILPLLRRRRSCRRD